MNVLVYMCTHTQRALRNKHHYHQTKIVLSNSRELRRLEEWLLILFKTKLVSFNLSKWWCYFLLSRDRFCSKAQLILFTLLQLYSLCHSQKPICKPTYFASILTVIASYQLNVHTGFIWQTSELIGMKGMIKTREIIHWWMCWDLYGKNETLFQMSVGFLCRYTK